MPMKAPSASTGQTDSHPRNAPTIAIIAQSPPPIASWPRTSSVDRADQEHQSGAEERARSASDSPAGSGQSGKGEGEGRPAERTRGG